MSAAADGWSCASRPRRPTSGRLRRARDGARRCTPSSGWSTMTYLADAGPSTITTRPTSPSPARRHRPAVGALADPVGRGLGFSGAVRVGWRRGRRRAARRRGGRSTDEAARREILDHRRRARAARRQRRGLVVRRHRGRGGAARVTGCRSAFDPAVVVWVPTRPTTSTEQLARPARPTRCRSPTPCSTSAAPRRSSPPAPPATWRLCGWRPRTACTRTAALRRVARVGGRPRRRPRRRRVGGLAVGQRSDDRRDVRAGPGRRDRGALPASGHVKLLRIDHDGVTVTGSPMRPRPEPGRRSPAVGVDRPLRPGTPMHRSSRSRRSALRAGRSSAQGTAPRRRGRGERAQAGDGAGGSTGRARRHEPSIVTSIRRPSSTIQVDVPTSDGEPTGSPEGADQSIASDRTRAAPTGGRGPAPPPRSAGRRRGRASAPSSRVTTAIGIPVMVRRRPRRRRRRRRRRRSRRTGTGPHPSAPTAHGVVARGRRVGRPGKREHRRSGSADWSASTTSVAIVRDGSGPRCSPVRPASLTTARRGHAESVSRRT